MDKQLLKAHGVESMVSADDAGGMRPFPFAYSPGADLIVQTKDIERARAILDNVTPQE